MLKISIDGPKGSGKSTLSSLFATELEARHEVASYKHVYTPEQYKAIINGHDQTGIERDLIMERGIMSSWVYTWLRDGTFFCDDWYKPLSISHFREVISEFDAFVVLYASDENWLRKRINQRLGDTGKGADAREIRELAQTNELYRMFAHFFKTQCSMDNVFMIDICSGLTPRGQYEAILEHAREVTGATPVPRNDLP